MNVRPLNVLLVLFLAVSIDAISVASRLKQFYDPNARCKFQIAKNLPSGSTPRAAKSFLSTIKRIYSRLNCSYVYLDYKETGLPDENGTYSGAIGLIQKNEQDHAMVFVRPDSLPFEPGKLTPVIASADVTIISHQNRSRLTTHELTHFLSKDFSVYAYSFIFLFFIFATLYAFAEIIVFYDSPLTKLSEGIFFRKYIRTCQQVSALLVDQEQFSPFSVTGRVLCWSICTFYFVLICGLLLNTIGADLVVSIPPENIGSLDDLLVRPIQPYIVKNLFLYELLKTSIPGSQLNRLWLKTGAVNKGMFEMDSTKFESASLRLAKLVNEIASSSSALIIQNSVVEQGAKAALCMYFPVFENMTRTTELFAPGVITGLLSSKIHPYTEKLLIFVYQSIFEMRLMTGMNQNLFNAIKEFTGSSSSKAVECANKPKEFGNQDEHFFAPFKLSDMSSLFVAYFVLSMTAFILFGCSVLYSALTSPEINRRKSKVHLAHLVPHKLPNVSICRVAPGRKITFIPSPAAFVAIGKRRSL